MAEIVTDSPVIKVPAPTSAVYTDDYNFIFYRNELEQLQYVKFRDGKDEPGENGSVVWDGNFVTVGTGGIEATTTADGGIRVYLIKDNKLVEFGSDKNGRKWFKGDLTSVNVQVQKGSVLSVIGNPVRVLFQAPGDETRVSQAWWTGSRWETKLLTLVNVPAK